MNKASAACYNQVKRFMEHTFVPPRRLGLVFHLGVLFMLLIVAAIGLDRGSNTEVGLRYFLFIMLFLIAVIPVPVVVYRIYVLLRSSYTVSPEGFRLRWGLRLEDIPMDTIMEVVRVDQLPLGLPVPVSRMPGSVIGVRRSPRYGDLEFMGTTPQNMVMIRTSHRSYVISPQKPEALLAAYQRANEIGTLSPVRAQSIYPGSMFGDVWGAPPARLLIIVGLLLGAAILTWSSLVLPSFPELQLPVTGSDLNPRVVTISQLIFLSILNLVFYVVNLVLGLFFFRLPSTRPLAYLLLSSSILTSLLAFIGIWRATVQGIMPV